MGRPAITQEDAIRKFREVHGDVYDYSKTEYEFAAKKVIITCRVHGDFLKLPMSHLQGSKCILCRNEFTAKRLLGSIETFIEKAQAQHGNTYNYSNSVYLGSNRKIGIECATHGLFSQTAGKHLIGTGCPECSIPGFSKIKPGIIYVLQSGNVTKVGITNNGLRQRVSRVSVKSGSRFTVTKQFNFLLGIECAKAESEILKELRATYAGVDRRFEGYTECFLNVDVQGLLLRLQELKDKYE